MAKEEYKWRNHPNSPCAQPFNIKGKKNKSKQKCWWNEAYKNTKPVVVETEEE